MSETPSCCVFSVLTRFLSRSKWQLDQKAAPTKLRKPIQFKIGKKGKGSPAKAANALEKADSQSSAKSESAEQRGTLGGRDENRRQPCVLGILDTNMLIEDRDFQALAEFCREHAPIPSSSTVGE